MRNFTKQFTNKTLFKPTRWLLMALMLLLGTGSAWGAISIPGSFNNWNHTDAIIENGTIHSYSVKLEAKKTYNFTLNDGAKQDNRVEYGASGATMYRDNCTNWLLGNQNTLCNIYADVAGTYTFTYLGWDNNDQDGNGKGPRISVTYPPEPDINQCTPTVDNQIIIKCKTDETNVYAWVWDSDKNNYNGDEWPGNEITKTENGYLVLEITTTKDLNVIFSDGQNNKTADITGLEVGKEYTYTYNNKDYELTNEDCITPSCVAPTFTLENNVDGTVTAYYTGSAQKPTITGDVTPTTVKYNGTEIANGPTNVGSYKVTVTSAESGSYCAATDLEIGTFKIVCPAVDAPTIGTITNIIKCGDDVTTNGSFTFNEEEGLTYTCDGGTVGDGTVTGITAAGDYILTATNGCGGTATKEVNISETQNKKTLTAISGNPLVCAQKSASLNKFSVNQIDRATYYWSIVDRVGMVGTLSKDAGCGNNCHITGLETGVNQGGSATLQVYAEYESCRTDTKTLALKQLHTNSDQAATISGETSMCADATQTLTVSNALGNIDPQWTSSNTAVATVDANGKVTAIATGTTDITYSILSACGDRVKSNTLTITVTGTPTNLYIGRTSANQVCAGEAITILAKANGATTYQLHYKGKLDDNQAIQTINSTEGQVTFTQTEATAGTYSYVVVIKNACKRTNTDAVQVEVLSTPKAPNFTTDGEITCSGVTVSPKLSPALAQGNYLVWYNAETGGNKIGTDGKTLTSGADETVNTYYAAVSNGSCESTDRTPYTVTVESSAISGLTLTLVDNKGNPLADGNNHVYCQGEDVRFKLTYNGGMYWGEPEWNSTVTQKGNMSGDLRYDPDNNRGEGTYTIPSVQASGTIQVALTMCGNNQATSNALTINVAPVPNIIEISASPTEAKCYQNVTLTATTENTIEGSLVIWYKGGTEVGRGDSYTFTSETASTVDDITASVQNTQYCAAVTKPAPSVPFTAESCSAPALKQGGIVYMVPSDDWKKDKAWFAAVFFKTVNSTEKCYWITMLDEDGDGVYACEVPSGYSKVEFCRMSPDAGFGTMEMLTEITSENHKNWTYKWNSTGQKTIPSTAKKFSINGWNSCDDGASLQSGVTFRTVELNAGENWHDLTTGVKFEVHAWEGNNSGTWYRMVDADGDRIYHVDIPSNCDQLLFARLSYDATDHEYNTIWNQTENLYATGGTRYVITQKYDANRTSTGYWSWPDKGSNTYALGVNTTNAAQDGENLAINCSAQIFKTSCAPGIWYGFQYKLGDGNYQNVKVGEGYLEAGDTYKTKLINLEAGTYTVRARVQYANNTAVYGEPITVIVGHQCTEGYEFTLASATNDILECSSNEKILPAMDIVGDKNNAGQSFTYSWTNEDGSIATNLSANNVETPTFNGTESQTYKVKASKIVGGNVMCVSEATYQVNYIDNRPSASIEAEESYDMNAIATLNGTILNSEGFTWLVKEGEKVVTSSMLSDATKLNPTFKTSEAGTYVVTLTAHATTYCAASSVSKTITVNAPVEVCGGTDIEVAYDFSKGKPGWFNTSDYYYTYKTNGGECVYTTTGDNKLYQRKPSFTIDCSNLDSDDFPITLYFCSQSKTTGGSNYGYAEGQILESHKGKKVSFYIPSDASYTTQKSAICIIQESEPDTKYLDKSNKDLAISSSVANTTISAPSVTKPNAILEGTNNYATLSAYFDGTGCDAISSYGFEWIQSETQPTSWSKANRVEVGTSTPTLGKSFSTKIENLDKGTYWFRGYATNSKTTGYSADASFLIITNGAYPRIDCSSLKITNNKVHVTITNQGNETLPKGSYQLLIANQSVAMPYDPSPVPAIEASKSQEFITSIEVMNPQNYNTVVTLRYQGREQQCSISRCEPKVGGQDTIYYTIDAAALTDKCMLTFPTVFDAVNHLKEATQKIPGSDQGYFVDKVGDGYVLRQPVVMQVAYSSNRYVGNVRIGTVGGMTDGRKDPLVLNITNINNDGNSASKGYDDKGNYYPLIIRAANPNAIPSVQHIALRKSRQVTLQNLNIVSSDTDIDNAIDIDNNNNSWTENAIGAFRANIRVTNCNIKSKGFTCIHVSAVEDVFFQNNEINADLTNNDIKDNNTRIWGASAKFIRSTRILFMRNNFTGTHATSVWLQGCETVLFMNNVFWNNNSISSGYPAMIRLIQQTGPEEPKNSGFYYNTMYLAESNSPAKNFDFLALNTQEDNGNINHNGSFQTSTIEFMYNNCYSYSATTAGKSSKPLKDKSAWSGICSNNFWSIYDKNKGNATSVFQLKGCNVATPSINVQENVCKTTASDPNMLVINGEGLNIGIQPESNLAKKLGANLITSDRTRTNVRPTTPTIINPNDIPSGVVDGNGTAPAIALVVSDEVGNETMTHTLDVVTYTGGARATDYTAKLESNQDFTLTDNEAGEVIVSFNKKDKTQNLAYYNKVIITRTGATLDSIVVPITGKYVASYTGGWTLGAYQQTESIATDSIIWQGSVDSDWDNRGNWIDAKTKNPITCINTLASNLKVIIPAPESQSYPTPVDGIVNYPELPASFAERNETLYGLEIVNAGQGLGTAKQFADHIILEYGASLRGVEALVEKDGDTEIRRYNEATTHLEVQRSEWILVGNMLKPFTNINKTETRLLKSGDYYFVRQEPNVYMHQVTIENNTPTWQKTFADLEVTVQPQEAFAIQLPNQYGKYKLSAEMYYSYVSPNEAKIRDAKVAKKYTFNGRFINESEALTFTGLATTYKIVNNTYPCNLNANAIKDKGYDIQMYDYEGRSWGAPDQEGSTIKPQHGFAIKQITGGSPLKVTREMLAGGDTRYNRSASVMPYNVIKLLNANSTDGYASKVQIIYDADKAGTGLDARDSEKLWSNDENVPDLYMMLYDATLQSAYIEKAATVIPLGVKLSQDMDVTFALYKTKGYQEATLQDRETGKEYDLLNGKGVTIMGLSQGVIEGRFYLNLVVEDPFEDPTTNIDAVENEASINIYATEGNSISVLGNNVELQTIYISDMSGRTQRYDVSGNYANITLPVNKGIYLVQVIGDNVTRTEKVVIK